MALKGILKNSTTRLLADRVNLLIDTMRRAIVKIENENNSDFNAIANDMNGRMFSIVANNEIGEELDGLFAAYNKVGKDFKSKYLLSVELFSFGKNITNIQSSETDAELLNTIGLVIQSINLSYAYDNAVNIAYQNKVELDGVIQQLDGEYVVVSDNPLIDSDSRLSMLEIKTAVMRFFSTLELKDLTTYTTNLMPSSVLAYSLYGDSSKNSEIIDYLSEQDLYTSADIIFFEDIFNNTLKNIVELRELITPFLNISLDRLSKVEEAVMLVATYELKERIDIPLKTIINEAVEVDKCLGSNDGHRIVNGVLDKIAKKLRCKSH